MFLDARQNGPAAFYIPGIVMIVLAILIVTVCGGYFMYRSYKRRKGLGMNAAEISHTMTLRQLERQRIAELQIQQEAIPPVWGHKIEIDEIESAFPMRFATLEDVSTCSICLCTLSTPSGLKSAEETTLSEQVYLRTLFCGHVFHSACVDEWLQSSKTHLECPICRYDLQNALLPSRE
jgi:hypothetical protein